MSLRYRELSLSAQTAYAELFEACRAAELRRSVAHLNGSFCSKTVKGHTYWYYQYRELTGRVRQIYAGPDSERLRQLMSEAGKEPRAAIGPLARSAAALGCAAALPRHYRIIRRLAEYGFFHAGGLLIGTHAYLCHGNLLGVAWRSAARTQDLDFAHAGRNISIALPANPSVDVHGALESLEMGFLPITSLQGDPGATYITPGDTGLRIDFLTVLHRQRDKPINLPNLNVALQPLKFMEFSLERPIQGALLGPDGAVTVNLPAPARYAVHKLLVWTERTAAYRTKANKDLEQSAALFEYFRDQREDEIRDAWRDAISRGRGWASRARAGLKALARSAPDLADSLNSIR